MMKFKAAKLCPLLPQKIGTNALMVNFPYVSEQSRNNVVKISRWIVSNIDPESQIGELRLSIARATEQEHRLGRTSSRSAGHFPSSRMFLAGIHALNTFAAHLMFHQVSFVTYPFTISFSPDLAAILNRFVAVSGFLTIFGG